MSWLNGSAVRNRAVEASLNGGVMTNEFIHAVIVVFVCVPAPKTSNNSSSTCDELDFKA